jgi:hypothetical protein
MRGGDLLYAEFLFYTLGGGAAALMSRQKITRHPERDHVPARSGRHFRESRKKDVRSQPRAGLHR